MLERQRRVPHPDDRWQEEKAALAWKKDEVKETAKVRRMGLEEWFRG